MLDLIFLLVAAFILRCGTSFFYMPFTPPPSPPLISKMASSNIFNVFQLKKSYLAKHAGPDLGRGGRVGGGTNKRPEIEHMTSELDNKQKHL